MSAAHSPPGLAAVPNEPRSMNSDEKALQDWIEQIDGAAALLRPSPWRLTANAALDRLLGDAPRDRAGFDASFGASPAAAPAPFAGGQAFQARLRITPSAGATAPRLLHADFGPLQGSDLWLATFIDLTDSEQRRERRALTLAHLQHTLDQLQELISLLTAEDETLLFANASYAHFFGSTPAQVLGRPIAEVMGEFNYGWTAPYRNELFRTRRPQRFERALTNGQGEERVVQALLWPLEDAPGGPLRMATLTRDVTLRHQGMQALRQTLDRLDALFEAGIEGIVLCERGTITDANPIACGHMGLAHAQLVGQPLAQVLERLDVPPAAHGGGPNDPPLPHLSLLPGEGGRPPLQIWPVTFMDADQPCEAVLLQDVSHRHQAQRRIDRLLHDLRGQTARAEAADRGKSVFLASASHDLRQPIHALGLFLTTIRSLSHSAADLRGQALAPVVQRMRSSLNGLTDLLNLLLGASLVDARRKQLPLRPTPLQARFDELLSTYAAVAAEKGLVLSAVPSRAWVLGDATVLRRILNNLVSNALRYTERGRVVIGARARGAQVELQVWDSGIGIAPEQLETIFREFYRVDLKPAAGERAEGLGLSIVRRAAAELGARLDVRSVPGRGSMFSVLLPRCEPADLQAPAEATAPVPAPDPVPVPATQGRHVLLIDDDEQVLVATAQLLEAWGYHVLSAPSATEAMRLCETDPQRIDLVICDYMLDPSMDGLDLLLRLRRGHPGPLPVCMVTGDMSSQRIAQARQHGFALLHKPVNARELQRFLQSGA